ncbi:MAG: class I SAM-dependent methyltransferase [Vicinamibacterales bacterium]
MSLATPADWVAQRFTRHYDDWRARRVAAIRGHYGDAFFKGRTLLELGCGYGDLGAAFQALGADVCCADAREEHLEVVRARHPGLRTVRADLNTEWPFGPVDVIFHLGLLYHLEPTHESLRRACRSAPVVVVETEVCDSASPDAVIPADEQGYDQAIDGRGCRPSAARVERVLSEEGFTWTRVADGRCNSGIHVYDWAETGSGRVAQGLRRFWFTERAA